jgi:DNA-binding LacI/PurR family transcriptional regulator
MIKTESVKVQLVRQTVLGWAKEGRFGPGDQLPSEREIAQKLNMSHVTVRRGLQLLADEGLLHKQAGVGTFITPMCQDVCETNLALVLPQYLLNGDRKHPGVGLVFDGLTDVIDPRKYLLGTMKFRRNYFWTDVCELCVHRKYAGMVLWPDSSITPEEIRKLQAGGVKIVMIDHARKLSGMGLPSVLTNQEGAFMDAMKGLVNRGHRRIRFVLYRFNMLASRFEDLLSPLMQETRIEAGLDVIPYIGETPDYSVLSGVLDSGPTAVVVADEHVAKRMFGLCRERGIEVPRDLSIVSLVDNTPWEHPVSLSAPDTPGLQVKTAKAAGKMLVDLVDNKVSDACDMVFHAPIQWRQSVASMSDSQSEGR